MSDERMFADEFDVESPTKGPTNHAALVIGIAGALVVFLAFAAWWMFSSTPTIGKGATAMSTARVSIGPVPGQTGVGVAPSETFVVPTPSFVTPSLDVALGALEPELPPETTTAPPTPSTSSSSSSSSSSTPPGQIGVRNLALGCSLQGKRVRATLSFLSSGKVPVILTAGDHTVTTTAAGNVRIETSGNAPSRGPALCSASVNGIQIGPIIAR